MRMRLEPQVRGSPPYCVLPSGPHQARSPGISDGWSPMSRLPSGLKSGLPVRTAEAVGRASYLIMKF
jgi:hypothetical protein